MGENVVIKLLSVLSMLSEQYKELANSDAGEWETGSAVATPRLSTKLSVNGSSESGEKFNSAKSDSLRGSAGFVVNLPVLAIRISHFWVCVRIWGTVRLNPASAINLEIRNET